MEKKKVPTLHLIKRFLPYFRPYRALLVFDLFCAALTTVCELVFPLIIRYITGIATESIELLTLRTVTTAGALYLMLRIIDTLATYYMSNRGHMMGAMIETDMRRDLFSHMQTLPFKFYDNTKVGQLMSRLTNDLFDVTEFAHHCPEEYFIGALKLIASFVILSFINVKLTLIIFACLPLIYFATRLFNTKMRRAFKASREAIGEINAITEDSLLGIRVVQSFAQEDTEREKFEKGSRTFLKWKGKVYKYMGAFNASMRLFDGVMYLTVIVCGALFLRAGGIDASDYVAYLLYVSTLLNSVRRIVEFTEQFQRGMTGIERFCEIMDTPSEIQDTENAQEIGEVTGTVEFDNVSFRYSDEGKDVLSKISLKVNPGEHIAFVGASGGGKTTLVNLIPRFYEITDGRILIDGKDIRSLTLGSLRENIATVSQDVYLFSGTVRENIAYGKKDATDAEIIEASKLAGAHEFIMSLENGYDTYIGERGVKLSGGQKQRISIARAFIKNPPILILDEATSALDSETEKLIQKSLERLAQGRTTFTIAHRLTTVKNATDIVVLTEDGIVERGTHEELLELKGVYHQLYS